MSTVLEAEASTPLERGLEALNSGNPRHAAQHFLKAIEIDRQTTDAWCGLAEALYATQEYQGALLALNSALHVEPNAPKANAMRQHITGILERDEAELKKSDPTQFIDEMTHGDVFRLIQDYGPDAQHLDKTISMAARRRFFVSYFAWAIPTEEAIATIRRFANGQPILEVGAGKGLWASLLQKTGATVLATDDLSTHSGQNDPSDDPRYRVRKAFTFVERLNHLEALSKYGFCPTLMMCWPPFGLGMSEETLREYRGDRLVYIGEQQAAAEAVTGSESFHHRLQQDWHLSAKITVPRWPGVYDAVFLYRRKRI